MFAFALLCASVGFVHFAPLTFDDAFISFRYAENLAQGRGLVFNPGERVEGFSNPLWTVALALPAWLGATGSDLGLLLTAKALGVVCAVLTLFVVERCAAFGRVGRERQSAPLAAAYLATLAPFTCWAVGALETPLTALLLAWTLACHLREDAALGGSEPRLPFSYAVLCLAALSRPEPLVLFAPLVLLRFARGGFLRRNHARLGRELGYLLLFLAPYACFLAGRLAYYGQLLPNTYYAKRLGDDYAPLRALHYFETAGALLNWSGLGLTALLIGLLVRRLSYRGGAAVLLALCYSAAVFYEGADWMPGYRMLVPMLPLVAVFVHELWRAIDVVTPLALAPRRALPAWLLAPVWLDAWQCAVASWAGGERASAKEHWMRRGLRLLLLGMLVIGSVRSFESVRVGSFRSGLRQLTWDRSSSHFEVARWMQRELPAPGLLALGEAGIIPYYTRLPILDLYGLTDAHIAHLSGVMHRKFDADYFFARDPEYTFLLVTRGPDGRIESNYHYARVLLGDARFAERYTPLHDFGNGLLYRRRR